MVPRTSDGRVLFVIPWHGHAVAGTTDTPLDAPSLEPRPLDEEIEFILETAARYLDPAADAGRCAGGLCGAASAGQGRRQDLGALARSRDPRGHFGPADHHRRQVDHLSPHGRGLRGPRDYAGQTARRALPHAQPENSRLSARLGGAGAVSRCTAPMPMRFARWPRVPRRLPRSLHPDLPYIAAEVVWAARAEMARTVEDVLARHTRALFLNANAAIAMAEPVARLLAAELGRDEAWVAAQVKEFRALAEQYRVCRRSRSRFPTWRIQMATQCTHVADHLKKVKPQYQRLRGVPENRRHLGAPAHVPGVRPCGLLRLVKEPPRARPLPRHAAPADSIRRARRRLALVLHRRDVPVACQASATSIFLPSRIELDDLEAADLAFAQRLGLC